MSFYALADRWLDVYRQTALVLDAVDAAATFTISRQPSRAARVKVRVYNGTSNTGTVTITGTVDGTAGISEVLTFTGTGWQTTTRLFSALSAITSTGLADETTKPKVEATQVGQDGSPQPGFYVIQASQPANFKRSNAAEQWANDKGGANVQRDGRLIFMYSDVWQPREGDVFRDIITGEQWLATGVPQSRGSLRTLTWSVAVMLRPNTV